MMTEIWDRFLTEQDKTLLAAKRRPVRPIGFGERPALIMIDNYRYAVGDVRLPILESTAHWPGSMGEAAWDALDRIQELLAVGRKARVPIVHVTGLKEEESGIPPRLRSHRRDELSGSLLDKYDRFYDFVEQAAPEPGEVVLRKLGPSAFWGTPLVAYLVEQRVDTVVLAGESTSGCVRATMIDATAYRFRVMVVTDCVYDRFEASHAMSLFDMSQKGCDLVTASEIIGHLSSTDHA